MITKDAQEMASKDIVAFVRKHYLAAESLAEEQLAEIIRQVLDSGDLLRHVRSDFQGVSYQPYRFKMKILERVHKLERAVEAMKSALEWYAENDVYMFPDDWDYAGEGGSPELSDCVECSYAASDALGELYSLDK